MTASACNVVNFSRGVQFICKQQFFSRYYLDTIWPFRCNQWCIRDARSTQSGKIFETFPAVIAAAFRADSGSVGREFEFHSSTFTFD